MAMMGLLTTGACMTGTSTPGVRNCVNVFFVIGYYQSCEKGPEWDETVKSPPQPHPGPVPPTVTDMPGPRGAVARASENVRNNAAAAEGDGTGSGWWCAANGEMGTCASSPAECEGDREFVNQARPPEQQLGACAMQSVAICARSSCFPTPAACLGAERRAKRDGSWCAARR